MTRDVKMSHVIETPEPAFEVLSQQRAHSNFAVLLVRARANPLDLLPSIRREVATLEPDATILAARTIEKDLLATLSAARMATTLTTAFGLAALALAVIGLYGVTSYAVARRTREIGLRMALGAERGRVLWLVLKEVAVLSCAGVIAGLAGAFYLTRHVESQLFGIAPNDPATLAAAVGLLLVIALLAGWMPARRATRIDPMLALRTE